MKAKPEQRRAASQKPDAHEIHLANSLAWNLTLPYYEAKAARALPLLRAGKVFLHPIEQRLLRSRLPAQTVVHLQCAGGVETLSLVNAGASHVIGIDIAESLIGCARRLGEQLNAPAEWLVADVLDPPRSLRSCADGIYTGQGALPWVHDLAAWARAVAAILRPDGWLVLFDLHPCSVMFDEDAQELSSTGVTYFAPLLRWSRWTGAYIGSLQDSAALKQSKKVARVWPPSAVISALLDAGLNVNGFGEYPDAYWDAFPALQPADRRKVPCTYSVTATKPAGSGHAGG